MLTVSSLVLDDWNAAFGTAGLTVAAKYLADAISVYCGRPIDNPIDTTTPGFATLLALFLTQPAPTPYWARLSDPNVSYANEESGVGAMGLAGLYDAAAGLPDLSAICAPVPDPFQASEVAKVSWQGSTSYVFSFQATASGITSDDETSSHDGNYEIRLPYDPPSAQKVGTIQGNDVIEWVATWVNPNPWSVLIEVVDPIPDGTEYTTSPAPVSCEGSIITGAPANLPLCEFNSGANQIEFNALVPPNGEVRVTFYTSITDPERSVFVSTAEACWDSNGTGEIIPDSGDLCPQETSAEVDGGPDPDPIPALSPAGQLAALVGLGAIGIRRLRRRSPGKKIERRRS